MPTLRVNPIKVKFDYQKKTYQFIAANATINNGEFVFSGFSFDDLNFTRDSWERLTHVIQRPLPIFELIGKDLVLTITEEDEKSTLDVHGYLNAIDWDPSIMVFKVTYYPNQIRPFLIDL